jgi:hypothetical protein
MTTILAIIFSAFYVGFVAVMTGVSVFDVLDKTTVPRVVAVWMALACGTLWFVLAGILYDLTVR